ncbi:MAG TPA: YlxR family protein [Mycetocola sp.]|jgi:predicted RNA-binding protein YlxR (DUF448 family)|uniref:YlxR family protein n=1 Tax=Mycetocola sp. TaxID=1871042 RepID=UPI00260D5EBB|nr:YlxR family protein [Mycetocola sp.]HEV7849321.1 YlxR family protein [Mycetocola sp.]
MGPVRTCVGCRARADRSSLMRIVVRDFELVVDTAAVLPGRGAWLHPQIQCYQLAVKRRAFGRALRTDGKLDTAALENSVRENRLNG